MILAVVGLSGCSSADSAEAVRSETAFQSSGIAQADLAQPAGAEIGFADYREYSDELHDSLLGKEAFAITFHADWCSTCIYLDKQINNYLGSFPADFKILKSDYDTERALKQKYGIRVQSTVVVIDADGNVSDILIAPRVKKLISAIEKVLN